MADELTSRLSALFFDEAPCWAALLDRQLRLVAVNPAFAKVFGERLQEPCHVVYKRRDAPCAACPAQAVFGDGQPRTRCESGCDGDGEHLRYRARSVPLRDHSGAITHVLQLSVDITAREAQEKQLEQAERLATVGLTTAGLAHTIKNILAGLEGGIYVVNSGLERDDVERLKAGWTMVQAYIEQVGTLVRNLLRYARVEPAAREEVRAGELVGEVVELYASKADLVGIELVAEVDPELPTLMLERAGTHACLSNLVTNAIDACVWDPADGKSHRVTVAARARPAGGVRLEVADNGMGIAAENQHKVLASSFTTKGMRGTGLGLLLTKKTVQEHGGEISFSSVPGRGTTFRIDLPGVHAAAREGAAGGATSPDPRPKE